jgi:4-carboxymuconolactone decarboxylase
MTEAVSGLGSVDYHERRERGGRVYREIMHAEPPAVTSPRSAALVDFVFAEIWSRGGLGRRERRLIAVACIAGADADRTLADHLYAALASGDLTYDELREAVLHFAVYCGWPKAEMFEAVLDAEWARLHAERGMTPPAPVEEPLTAIAADQEQRKRDGEQEFRDVNHAAAPARGVPFLDDGILNYVFGDLWRRPGLSRRDRRWVTLACVGLDDTIVPIRSHFYAALKSGDVTHAELREFVLHFAAHSGWPKASFLQQVVEEEHARVLAEAG